ncbi:uncharacterized protein LOC121968209 [Zingiber officinale]|uniref:uncharacterized protein LOC121968209 n=1 Tax=Zingiber officinale TaxID=94328 RepID=UPI001C4CE28C|nr:uncharacterized protein LOC121968209 [Zingiber officinale]
MSTTNSVKLVLHDGQTATEPIPFFDRDEQIQSMTFMLGWTSVALSKTSPSAVEVVVHQLDQQPPQPPPPPPPSASEEENRTEIVVEDEEIKHQEHEQGSTGTHSSGLITEQYTREMRGLLMILATLFLQMAYQAGLNPPGGFWQDDLSALPAAAARHRAMTASSFAPPPLGGENGSDAVVPHKAGDPILRSKYRNCYNGFAWLNSLSLTCSSVLILFLLAQPLFRSRKVSHPRWPVLIMYVNLVIILAAYTTGAVTDAELMISLIPLEVMGGMSVIILYIYTEGKFFRGRKTRRQTSPLYI